jgi:DNA topoisomerase-1
VHGAAIRHVDRNAPGYTRRRHGRGFVYLDEHGRTIDDERRDRIRALAIPPAWEDVWICADDRGHLQATGVDHAGRVQYLYHPAWRAARDRAKFLRIEGFAEALPVLRRQVARDIRRRGYPRERILACSIRLLDRGLFRVGTEDYVSNGAFGLATLRREHVVVHRTSVDFDYVGKGGKRHVLEVVDADVVRVLRALRRRRAAPTDELLAWDDAGTWRTIRATDINEYLKRSSGEDFSAKDFRTWHATVLAATELAEHGVESSARASKRAIAHAAEVVSDQLGNTPAVARRSYIDPRVIARYLAGEILDLSEDEEDDPEHALETAVLDLLRSHPTRAWPEAA